MHNEFVDSMIDKGKTGVETYARLKGTERREFLQQRTPYTNHTTFNELGTTYTRYHVHILNHVTQMASEVEVIWFRECLLLNIAVMSISVSRIFSRGKHSSLALDIL